MIIYNFRILDKVASDKVASDKVASDKVASGQSSFRTKYLQDKVASGQSSFLRKVASTVNKGNGRSARPPGLPSSGRSAP